MDIIIAIIAALVGLAFGFLAAQLLATRKLSATAAESAAHAARSTQILAELENLRRQAATDLDTLRKQATADLEAARQQQSTEREKSESLGSRLATAEADRANLLQRLDEEAKRLTEIQTQFRTEFENLANRILEEKSTKFLSQNEEHLTTLLKPLRERLGEFKDRVEAIHTEDTKTTAALRQELGNLRDLNRQMTDEAGALTRALKGESKTQGLWGEMILERILEKSGLKKGEEYETQESYKGSEGTRFMPDVVIHLPEGKHLIIDSKVSLTAYERSTNANDEPARVLAMKEHTISLRRHIDGLSGKNYPGLSGLESPDFVLMFVPIEPALHLALQHDPSLYADAFDKNVVLVSSSTLLVALRAVESVWRRHKQTLNSLEIARQAGNLHDQFVLFVESLQDIGQRLEQARASYDKTLSRLSQGRGSLVTRTAALKKLGARTEKEIPKALLQAAETESLNTPDEASTPSALENRPPKPSPGEGRKKDTAPPPIDPLLPL